jgi:nucleoid-associated protein
MPIRHAIVHQLDKQPDGNPPSCTPVTELPATDAIENLQADLNDSYNAKQGKAWGFFHGESGAYPFSGWLKQYLEEQQDFTSFSRVSVEHLQKLIEEVNLSTGGHVLFSHYQQGMTEYLMIAILQQVETVAVDGDLNVVASRYLDTSNFTCAARINLSEWRNNPNSKQYISFVKGKTAGRARLLPRLHRLPWKASTAQVKPARCSRHSPTSSRKKISRKKAPGENPRAARLRHHPKSWGSLSLRKSCRRLSMKTALRRSTTTSATATTACHPRSRPTSARSTSSAVSPAAPRGLSISFEAHLLGSNVTYDADTGSLTIKNLPTQLTDQLKRRQ